MRLPISRPVSGRSLGGPRWPIDVNAGGWVQWPTLPTTSLNLLPKQCLSAALRESDGPEPVPVEHAGFFAVSLNTQS